MRRGRIFLFFRGRRDKRFEFSTIVFGTDEEIEVWRKRFLFIVVGGVGDM